MYAYIYGQDNGNLTVNQFEKDKYFCYNCTSSPGLQKRPMKLSFFIGKDPNTNENITMDVLGESSASTDTSTGLIIRKFPIPNQLLNGKFCGEVYFSHQVLTQVSASDPPSWWIYGPSREVPSTDNDGVYFILTINKADRPSDYECVPTPLLNDYNAEVVIDTSKASCLQIKSIDTNKLYTGTGGEEREWYNNLFGDCTNLTSLDLSNFNTSKVISMYSMFCNCTNLTSLDLSSFNTSKVFNMSNMFSSCKLLTSLNLSSFDTSTVSDMSGMFNVCMSLTSLDLSNFDTSKVTDMRSMFNYCTSLTSLDLSSFNTSKVTEMLGMFDDCKSLSTLTLGSNWGINTSISSFYLSSCPLTHNSCLDVFNKLADKTQTATTSATLTLKSSTKALMSSTEIAIATNKGWTVS